MSEEPRDFMESQPAADPLLPLPTEMPPPAPRKKGVAWLAWLPVILAWLVIIAAVGVVVWGQIRGEHRFAAATGESKLDYAVFELQVRNILGADNLLPGNSLDFYKQADTLDRGPPGQRLRFIVVAGEMAGPDEALHRITVLRKQLVKHKVQPTKDQKRLLEILDRLYRDYNSLQFKAPSLTTADRQFLTSHLGWIGDLALAPRGYSWDAPSFAAAGGPLIAAALTRFPPPNPEKREQLLEPPTRTFLTFVSALAGMSFLGVLGFIALVLFLVLIFSGKVQGGIVCGIPHGGVYAETFALWMLLFFAISLGGRFLVDDLTESLLPVGAGMLFSLAALLWPVLRGVPWRQVREDIGWTAGRQPLVEPLIGIGSYAMALPLLAVGVAMMVSLLFIQQLFAEPTNGNPFARGGYPAHPIIEKLANGDLAVFLQIYLLAAVIAPIVEETMFRGVLYRHLRESSNRLGAIVSIFISGTVVSFIFAIIHPQGWVAVPALMALAYGFTIAREWRGTLIPAMIGHGLNNALVTTVAILALS